MNKITSRADYGLLPAPSQTRATSRSTQSRLSMRLTALLFLLLACQGFGAAFVILQLATFGTILYLNGRVVTLSLRRAWPFLLLPVWAAASYFWSTAPDNSLRYGIQLLLTAMMGLTVAAAVPLSRVPLVIFAGTSIAVLFSIMSGRMGPSEAGPVLIGVTGSKNQMAYLALMMMLAAVPVAAGLVTRTLVLRGAAIIMFVVGGVLVARSEAATAQVSLVAGALFFIALLVATMLSKTARFVSLLMIAVIFGGLIAAAPEVEKLSEYVITDVLKKDSTLTGRTVLWRKADQLINEHPVVGIGYRSFWTKGDLETIGMLRRMGVPDGRGFHWHDNIRELRVDLGFVGLAIGVLPLLLALGMLIVTMFARPSWQAAYLLTILFLLVPLRVRTDAIISPFLVDTIVLWMTLGYSVWLRTDPRPDPRARQLC